MTQLFKIRHIFSDVVEIVALDSATYNDGVIVGKRGNEQVRLYASSFTPLGELGQDQKWMAEEAELRAEADQFKQREQRRINEAHQLLADEYDKEQNTKDQDDADELKHSLEASL